MLGLGSRVFGIGFRVYGWKIFRLLDNELHGYLQVQVADVPTVAGIIFC